MNEPLTTEKCHVCDGPIATDKAVKEDAGLEHRHAAECVDFLRARLEAAEKRALTAEAHVVGLEMQNSGLLDALKACRDSLFRDSLLSVREGWGKLRLAADDAAKALAALSADSLPLGKAALEVARLYAAVEAEHGDATIEMENELRDAVEEMCGLISGSVLKGDR